MPGFFFAHPEEAGRALEGEVNASGPGEATFIQCDVSKEDQIKVRGCIDLHQV